MSWCNETKSRHPWRFEITHLPGKSSLAADATSRHPSPSGSTNSTSSAVGEPEMIEDAVMDSIQTDAQELGSISWPLLVQATAADQSFTRLLTSIEHEGGIDSKDPALASLSPFCESIYAYKGVLLYQDRVIVPKSLRHRVLQLLHAAHQGTSSMEQRARATVFWPGMSKDITRERCVACNRNTPSLAATPPIPLRPPSTLFEAIFADFFVYGGVTTSLSGTASQAGWRC